MKNVKDMTQQVEAHRQRVCVVGGGTAGLTLAYNLVQKELRRQSLAHGALGLKAEGRLKMTERGVWGTEPTIK